ncbi:MAG: head decoration protein [Thermomonas sp.]|uniref:head decoration protein n=1 Tax=Thermomonas sp. TaxID=1971895 RepID=UPI00260E931E|nr:head decoration protein [Thermomonas sp.]MBE7527457.1 head decoration protein [Burkholderiales bacterium]MCC7096914.1 head decoration protein [Thermomonas sp.]
MPTVSQPKNLGDLLKYEAPNLYSRETDTVAAGQKLVLGTVLGRDTTSTKLKAFDPDATDGSEIAIGILASDVDATLIDRDDALVIARHAIVARGALVWPTGITTAQKAAAIAQLTFLGVLVRDSA